MDTITITLHAHLKKKAGTDRVELRVPFGTTVSELKAVLLEHYPRLRPQLANVVTLVNKKTFYLEHEALPPAAEVTFLPPIGGG